MNMFDYEDTPYYQRAQAWLMINELCELFDSLDDKILEQKEEVLDHPVFQEYKKLEEIPQSKIVAYKISMLIQVLASQGQIIGAEVIHDMIMNREKHQKILVKPLDIN